MKKTLVLLFAFLFLFWGCAKSEEQKVTNGISFTAFISAKGKDFTINGSVDKTGILNANVLSPETIKGLQIYADKENVYFEFLGLKYENNISKYPISNIVNLILSSLNEDTSQTDKKTGNIKGYDYILLFDENGYPEKLQIEELDITVEFKDVQKISE